MNKLPVAVQVYSVRADAEKDFGGTLAKIKAMGYEGVELAGLYGLPAKTIRQLITDNGLVPLSAHVPYLDMVADLDGVLDDYKEIGMEYIAVPFLLDAYRPGHELFNSVVDFIPVIGDACNRRGMQLLYHNHDFEFAQMPDGQYALDYLYSVIPSNLLKTEIDTCWVNVAGENPCDYVRKYTGRAPVVHLKDFWMNRETKPDAMYELIGVKSEKKVDRSSFEFRPLGLGLQDLPGLLQASLDAQAKWVVVEQDASVGRTPLEAIALSRQNLAAQGW